MAPGRKGSRTRLWDRRQAAPALITVGPAMEQRISSPQAPAALREKKERL